MTMPGQLGFAYEFACFRLDTVERQLLRDGRALSLSPAAIAILIALVEHSEQAVSIEDLTRSVWPEALPEPGALALHIEELDQMLGRHEGGQPYIELLPGTGYRFAAPMLLASEVSFVLPLESSLASTQRLAANTGRRLSEEQLRERIAALQIDFAGSRYEILSLLGSGGMGEVYLARDRQLDRQLALKLLSDACVQEVESLSRLIFEAKAASALNHPNIITIHEVGQAGGHHFIATEYIAGETLRAHMAGRRLPIAAALAIVVQIAGALAAAHAAGIVHRDIKPENVMIRPDGYVKLLDFGLAKLARSALADAADGHSQPGVVMGTVSYMSPEQARGQAVDARSDVFSLGVLLYELLAGRSPFAARTSSDVMAAILQRQPLPLTERVQSAPAELERVVSKALRKDRNARHQNVDEFLLDLKRLQRELELRSHVDEIAARPASPDAGSPRRPHPGESQHSSGFDIEAEFIIPEVRYARSGDINIAYQVIGDAPLDLVFVMGWISHLEYFWTEPSFARFLRRLASFCRVILFDKRGTGLSDSVPLEQLPTLEQRMDDVRAVMEAVGSERAVLCGVSEGGPMCSLFAATYPERTIALVMMGSYARRLRGEGYPWGPSEADRDLFLEEIRNHWGGPVGLEDRAPSVAKDPAFRQWWAAYLRRGASPGAAVALTRMNTEIDIRQVLPTVRVPTLVVHRSGDLCLKVEEGRYLAENIPGAKFVELAGVDHLPFVGAQDEILDEIEEFLTGMRHASGFDRVLATVLVARMVDREVAVAGDADRWSRHQSFFRKEVELFKGSAVDLSGDHILATFDGPARAVRAACAIEASARRLGLELRSGLHTGECDVMGDRVGGVAVRIAEQVAAGASVGEVLVSSTVKDLVAGSGIRFSARGSRELPEQLGEWRMFAVEHSA
jgi:serine/threonine protein kinase/DNA-binding winged helix-turn-helix (wHTH) protein